MRKRRLAAMAVPVGIGALAAAACSAFDADVSPKPIDAGDEAAVIAAHDASAPELNDASPPDGELPFAVPIEGGVLTQVAAGTGCAGRAPPWKQCHDYEAEAFVAEIEGQEATAAIEADDDGNKLVRATIRDKAAGHAFHPIRVSPTASHVVWSFDVHISPRLAQSTEFGSLSLPMGGPKSCVIQLDRVGDKVRLVDYCVDGGNTEKVLGQVAISPMADAWYNVFVEVKLAERAARFTIVDASGARIGNGGGTLEKSTIGIDPVLRMGLSYTPGADPAPVVEIDNVVVWWNTP